MGMILLADDTAPAMDHDLMSLSMAVRGFCSAAALQGDTPEHVALPAALHVAWYRAANFPGASMTSPSIGLVTLALCLATLPAQRTWIVDASMGAGASFRELRDAFQVVNHGDTVIVRRGVYASAATDKGIAILGEPGAALGTAQQLTLRDLPPQYSARLKRMSDTSSRNYAAVSIERCRGIVTIEDVDLRGFWLWWPYIQALVVMDSSSVTVNRATLRGIPGLAVIRSTVLVTSSSITGESLFGISEATWPPSPAVTSVDSNLILAQTSCTGGNGGCDYLCRNFVPPCPAIEASASSLWITGDQSTHLRAGGDQVGARALAAIVLDAGSTLHLDPGAIVTGSGGGPPVLVRNGTLRSTVLPFLAARGAPPGANTSTTLHAPAGSTAALLFALPAPLASSSIGWLALGSPHVLYAFVAAMPADGRFTTPLTVPPLPALQGVPLAFQAVVAGAPVGAVSSLPVAVVLD